MIRTKKLDCGTTVIMEQIPHLQSVALGAWVRAGSVDEPSKIAGVSHYIEHMMFKGTENRTAKEIAADVDRIGGQFNAFTGKEATCYYIKTLSSNLDKAAEILLDMLLNSRMDEKEMQKEKSVICEEIKMIQDTPDDDAHDTVCELVFKGNPLGNSIIGTPASLDNIDRSVLVDYMTKEYTRDSIVIAIAGNFDENAICEMFQDKLKVLKAEKQPKAYTLEPYCPGYKVKTKDIEQSHISLAVRGVALEDEEYYAMGLLSNIMGGSMSSRLFQNIREEKGLAYSVYSVSSSFSNSGYFNIYAGVAHDKIRDAIEGIKEELETLKRSGVTEEELATAKEQMKSSYIFGQENVTGRMFSIGKNMVICGKIHTPEEVIEGFNRVTMDDIRRTAERICDMSAYCGAAVTNKDFDLKSIMEA
ncbi:insulinase family protein [Anaerovorax odorimutans]|uniref:Insulinase family protein n=1 Tax=Anaerovorax odorimutans TaxID=109327 RepID=A0ABT1RLB6_9FIRM|nr:pitrilysin family protein [Anaerovorax odorimutans]MCQ4635957.1 insulinase family protein [Anaerovorax odorimutans]